LRSGTVSETVAETERADGADDLTTHMRELADKSATVRRTRAAALEELADLPELTDVASAKACLARLLDLGVAGQLPGVVLGGCVRSVEVFLKACSDEQDRTTLLETRALLQRLKAERALMARRGRAG
jgi:hypothetical protein